MLLKTCIEQLMRGEELNHFSCQQVLDEILDSKVNPLQVAAFLVLLRTKHETANELSAIVTALRNKMIVVDTPYNVLDIVGTGGDGCHTVNISTASSMLAASCGIKIAKHGNRSVSSLAGSADVLEALGIKIELTPEQVSQCIDQIGIGFCYSPNFHPVTHALRQLRKELNVATTFNILGPLLNPAHAKHLILGVADDKMLSVMADVLMQIGNSRSMIVHSMGLDEISCAGSTTIIEVCQQEKIEYVINPIQFGFAQCRIVDLRGGDAHQNAQLLLNTFKGKQGPIADTLILNAAVALYLYGVYPSIQESIAHAHDNLVSGAVLTLLNNWIEFSHDQ